MRTIPQHTFVQGDITDPQTVADAAINEHQPRAVVHFAAESHVDRSIHGPWRVHSDERCRDAHSAGRQRSDYWQKLDEGRAQGRFSVYQRLDRPRCSARWQLDDRAVRREDTRYAPNSPYSASKAAADHLVRSYFQTFRPAGHHDALHQQLRPLPVSGEADPADDGINAVERKPLPVYGDGMNIQGLAVRARITAPRFTQRAGQGATRSEVYNIAGNCESDQPGTLSRRSAAKWTNKSLKCPAAHAWTAPRSDHVCSRPARPRPALRARHGQDREGDWGGSLSESFATGLRKTVSRGISIIAGMARRCHERPVPAVDWT